LDFDIKPKQNTQDFKDKPHLDRGSILNPLLKHPGYPDILFAFDLKHAHSIFFLVLACLG